MSVISYRKSKYIHTEKELIENFDLEVLYNEIHENKLTCNDIQAIYNIEKRFMSQYNKEHNWGIKRCWKNQKDKYIEKGIYKEDLYELYIIQELSLGAIGKIYGVEHGVIKSALLFFNITYEIRPFNYKKYYDCRRTGNNYGDRIYRQMMEEKIGRRLNENEVVHHINLNHDDNRIENLFLFDSRKKHNMYHGYIATHSYISPQHFLDEVYARYENTFLNYEWLYNEYIDKNHSIAQISRICEVSRVSVTSQLKETGIFHLRPTSVN